MTTKKEEILENKRFLALVFVFFYYNFYYSLIIKIIATVSMKIYTHNTT
ncbi:hypothetical protein TPHV1_20194 [Treponema phagedenis]|uniref:Uncharacterized protein n=1 Tax=Treponema phagedenis TaxID=162 RepID=A0A0B7GVS8_TREPH|nr:hypothetical protein TPHV1_20194 [Treponema phagedenis]